MSPEAGSIGLGLPILRDGISEQRRGRGAQGEGVRRWERAGDRAWRCSAIGWSGGAGK